MVYINYYATKVANTRIRGRENLKGNTPFVNSSILSARIVFHLIVTSGD